MSSSPTREAPPRAIPAPRRRPRLLLPALGVHVLIASGTFLVAKATLREIPPLVLALFRFVLATVVLWPMARALGRGARIRPEDRGRIWLLGLLAVPLNQGLFLYGLQWASVSHAALLYALTPAFAATAVAFTSGRHPTRVQVAGIAIAFLGVLTLLLQRGLRFESRAVVGDLLIFVAVIAWASYLVAGRKVTRRYGALLVTGEAMLAGTLLYLPIGLFTLRGYSPHEISTGAWSGLLYLALLTSALNYVILFWGLEYLKPVTVALLTNLQPVVTAAMAWVFLHERLTPAFAVSATLVLGGVWLAQAETLRAARPLDEGRPSP